jgi:hypothetical protein
VQKNLQLTVFKATVKFDSEGVEISEIVIVIKRVNEYIITNVRSGCRTRGFGGGNKAIVMRGDLLFDD